MKILFVLFLILITGPVGQAQSNCNCESELTFMVDYLEANLPGFKDNVDSTNADDYRLFKEKLLENASAAKNQTECFKTLTYYVEFFKDNHTVVYSTSEDVDTEDVAAVDKFLKSETFRSTEVYPLRPKQIKQHPLDDIRGIYQSEDSTYTVAIVPDKGTYRDYVGVITESKSRLWQKNQVRFELKRRDDGSFEVFDKDDDHSMNYARKFTLVNGILADRWYKTSLPRRENPVTDASEQADFQIIGDSVAYLRIPWFYVDKTTKIDSIVEVADRRIKKLPYLIIDVRNNGGGSTGNAVKVLDYFYTKPIRMVWSELYATEGNIKKYERLYGIVSQDEKNSGEGYLAFLRDEIAKMKAAPPNTFILRSSEEQYITRDAVLDRPRKVAVLYNKYCGSSCESFLFWAKESEKAVLVGENSGGYVGYGEAFRWDTPCYGFGFRSTMTRYEEKRRRYEADGIPPDHRLNYTDDWIEQTVKILKK